MAIVPGGDARHTAADALRHDDDPAAVELGNVGRALRMAGIGRMAFEIGAIGDTDEIGAEPARLRLDFVRGERLPEGRDHG